MGQSAQEEGSEEKEMKDIPYVFIATPAYDGKVDSDFAQSLIESAQHATIFGIRVTGAVMGNGAFIDLARNTFVRMFLEEYPDCTHLFFIDSDLRFESRAFVELVRNCDESRPVVSGMYRRRQEPEDYPVHWIPEPEASKETGEECLWIKDGWLMCDRVPTGFLCIHRSIIEPMAERAEKIKVAGQGPVPRLFYTKLDNNNRFVGEDFCWCDDYMEQFDEPIWCWPDFDFVHGGFKCNYQQWLAKQVEQRKGERKLGKKVA